MDISPTILYHGATPATLLDMNPARRIAATLTIAAAMLLPALPAAAHASPHPPGRVECVTVAIGWGTETTCRVVWPSNRGHADKGVAPRTWPTSIRY